MAQPENQYLITKIKAAITAKIRPVAMIFHEQPTDPWVSFDYKLLEAYQRLQDEICPQCGHPVWLCRSTSNHVEWKVKTGICYATKELEKVKVSKIRDKKQRDEARKQLDHAGEYYYTVPYTPPTVEGGLPTRQEYYDELAKMQ